MRKNKSSLLLSLVAVLSLSLFGCSSQVLDYQNAEINNGLIYAGHTNVPFTGTVTNVPDIKLYQSQEGFSMFAYIVAGTSFPGSGWKGRALTMAGISGYCKVSVREGILNGKAVCQAPGTNDTGTTMHFKGGVLDGSIEYYDSLLSKQKLSDAEFEEGLLTGEQTVYDGVTGKKAGIVHWENGQMNGRAQSWNRQGEPLVDTMYVNGKRVLTENEKFQNALSQPVAVVAPKPAEVQLPPGFRIDSCVTAWVAAYRKERDNPDVIVNDDQVVEWTHWCDKGKMPPAN